MQEHEGPTNQIDDTIAVRDVLNAAAWLAVVGGCELAGTLVLELLYHAEWPKDWRIDIQKLYPDELDIDGMRRKCVAGAQELLRRGNRINHHEGAECAATVLLIAAQAELSSTARAEVR